jgi:RecG-like helicase
MFDYLFILIIGIVFGFFLKKHFDNLLKKKETSQISLSSRSSSSTTINIYDIADQVSPFFENTAHPRDLMYSKEFLEGVDLFQNSQFSQKHLLEYATGDNPIISCMALAALNERDLNKEHINNLLLFINKINIWPLYFALQLLNNKKQKPLIGDVLLQVQHWWTENRLLIEILNSFIQERIERGETPTFAYKLSEKSEVILNLLEKLLAQLNQNIIQNLKAEIIERREKLLDKKFLNSFGKLWNMEEKQEFIFDYDQINIHVDQIEKALFQSPSQSVILIGENGVGKSTTIKLFTRKAKEKGWQIFEATATDVLADQIYIGELEERLSKLLKNLEKGKLAIWFVPNIHELIYAGRHLHSPLGILDKLLPYIENGTMLMIGETHPNAYQRLISENKAINSVFETIKISPLNDSDTLAIARAWVDFVETSHNMKFFLCE